MGIAIQRPGDPSSFASFVDGPDHDVAPMIHPDGDWIAYSTGEIPSLDVVVRPFPDGDGQWKVSREEAGFAFWSADGATLYYAVEQPGTPGGSIMEVAFDGSGDTPVFGVPKRLFSYTESTPVVAPDGRFVRIEDVKPAEGEEAPDVNGVVLVENWLARFGRSSR
jgi:Tol biopolymer transport system component